MIETLQTLHDFVKKYSQVEDGKLKYVFIGGTAVRLIQESIGSNEKRIISDFDIMSLNGTQYPVQTLDPEIIFGLDSVGKKDIANHVDKTFLDDHEIYFMDGTFISFTKTCSIDSPREKDYNDVLFLYNHGQIDFEKIGMILEKTGNLDSNPGVAVDSLEEILSGNVYGKDSGRIFQTFPKLVNLVGSFEDKDKVKNILSKYVSESNKRPYEISSIFFGVHSVIKNNPNSDVQNLSLLSRLLKKSHKMSYTEFDMMLRVGNSSRNKAYN